MVRWFGAATLPVASSVFLSASPAAPIDFDEAFAPRAAEPSFTRHEAAPLFSTAAVDG